MIHIGFDAVTGEFTVSPGSQKDLWSFQSSGYALLDLILSRLPDASVFAQDPHYYLLIFLRGTRSSPAELY